MFIFNNKPLTCLCPAQRNQGGKFVHSAGIRPAFCARARCRNRSRFWPLKLVPVIDAIRSIQPLHRYPSANAHPRIAVRNLTFRPYFFSTFFIFCPLHNIKCRYGNSLLPPTCGIVILVGALFGAAGLSLSLGTSWRLGGRLQDLSVLKNHP
jgi:hypothetical protein